MTAICHRHSFVYFPIPKNATSSMKRIMFQLETGRVWDRGDRKRLGVNIHALYPSKPNSVWKPYFHAYTSLVIFREPISRFLAVYANRVVHAKVLQMNDSFLSKITRARLSKHPDIDEFIAKFEAYRSISPEVNIHTLPQSDFVGQFWEKVNYRLPISDLGKVPEIIKQQTGKEILLPHAQTGGPKLSSDMLDSKQIKKLKKMYRSDYQMLGKYFSPP
ncbi:sulfotransferase family 2 domain-containing protein [Pseudomonadota bacterium]